MPRYFFHVVDGSFMPDHEGMECASLSEAKSAAVRAAGEMLHDQGIDLWRTGHWDMFVCDAGNNTRLKLSLSAELLTHEPDQ